MWSGSPESRSYEWAIFGVSVPGQQKFLGRCEPSTIVVLRGHGRDKLSEPMGAFLTQEVHFQNIEYMANGCKQSGFHSFIFTK